MSTARMGFKITLRTSGIGIGRVMGVLRRVGSSGPVPYRPISGEVYFVRLALSLFVRSWPLPNSTRVSPKGQAYCYSPRPQVRRMGVY